MKDSHEDTKARRIEGLEKDQAQDADSLRSFAPSREKNVEELSAIVVDCGYRLHVEAGPGLLETVYEVVLARILMQQGLKVERQAPVPIKLFGMTFEEGFRADIIVEDRLLIELKSVENLLPVHSKQVLTYLRLLKLPLGLLINFGAPTFKDGCKRIVNGHREIQTSLLRLNQEPHAKPRSSEEEGGMQ